MQRRFWTGLAGAAVLLASDALAIIAEGITDIKVFPGAVCRQVVGVWGDPPNALNFDGSGRIFNTSTSRVRVVCPLMRDAFTAGSEANVRVVDRNKAQNVECSLSGAVTSPTVATIGYSTDWWYSQRLYVGELPPDSLRTEVHLQCDLPPTDVAGASGLHAFEGWDHAEDSSGDWKSYPATYCAQTGTGSGGRYDADGAFTNAGTASISVVCPIVRDNVTSKWLQLQVRVQDSNTQAGVVCQAFSAQRDGMGWFTQVSTSVTGTQVTTLSFTAPTDERDFGSFYVKCTLPSKVAIASESGSPTYRISRIIEYRIQEGS